MSNQNSTNEEFNQLIDFRQTVYASGFTHRRDAQFELLDALLLAGAVESFPNLSRVPVFRRTWSSVYAAIEEGRHDGVELRQQLLQHVPPRGTAVFALDGSAWPRPQAPSLADRQYVYSPTQAVNGGSIVVGQPYSVLAWVAQPRSSWALPVDVERIASQTDAVQVGIDQVKRLCDQRPTQADQTETVIAADGQYGNHVFLGGVRPLACSTVVRLRKDRVLYRPPAPYPGKGRPAIHGPRFAFKKPDTWGPPDEHVELDDPRWGRVELKYWRGLHARQDAATPFDVLRAQVHLERDKPPDALWLGWQGQSRPAETIWRYYDQRWPIEPSIKWRKQQLHWTLPQFQTTEAMDRWTMLVTLAQWQLYLARPWVQDRPLPWQAKQTVLTPQRVQQGLGLLFLQIGTPAAAPQRRGKSPGWPKGRARTRPERHKVVKKAKKPRCKRRQTA